MQPILVKFVKVHEDAKLPFYASDGAAGADLYAVDEFDISHYPTKARTGLQVAWVMPGYELQIRPRSGMGSKGIIISNSPGTIDEDYRGEIMVLLASLVGCGALRIKAGDRIAQMVVAPVVRSSFEFVGKVNDTKRGDGGLGSTGS